MIKIENTEVQGFEAAIRGMRNPMNSWDKSDSDTKYRCTEDISEYCDMCGYDACNPFAGEGEFVVGKNDRDLMMRLAAAGPEHRKFMRFITVTADITAPLYWWKEYDTYKVGTVANSCSTMHKIHAKEFVLGDFSHEHLHDDWNDENSLVGYNGEYSNTPHDVLDWIIEVLNHYREKFLETKDKKYWWYMIQLLPSSYNQRRTVFLNYETLCNIYRQRLNHKLDEWRYFCKWIEILSESYLMTNKNQSEVKPGGQEEIL